ncbi:histidine kinase [Bernardetia sp.]|uniref:tetratricopeptide repeat-containing sensor histidine kinase n=1 Tax=Bernardetia sp. TaxID=1937974 RepID=UPI0025BE1E1A|nr:histidine kinase [Bernardetia sp.]
MKYITYFPLLFVSLIFTLNASAQNKAKLDSLEQLFSTSQSLDKKAVILTSLFLNNRNIEKQKKIYTRSKRLQSEHPSSAILAIYNEYMTLFLASQDSSITPSMIKRGLHIEKELDNYTVPLIHKIRIVDLIAELYQKTNQMKKSIEYNFYSIKLIENGVFETNQEKQKLLVIGYITLSNSLGVIKDENSLKYANKAIEILESSSFENKELLTGIYGNYTITLRRAGLYDSALVYAKKIEQLIPPSDKNRQAKAYHLIASIYTKLENYENAKVYAIKAFEVSEKNDRIFTSMMASYILGKAYNRLEQYDSAKISLERVAQQAKKLNQTDMLVNVYSELTFTCRKKMDINCAFKNIELANIYQDSVTQKRREKETKELAIKYETELKEATIEKLNQEAKIKDLELKNSYYIIAGSVILGFVILVAVWIFFRQKNIIDTFEKEQAKLRWRRAQINPHFFFNVLSAIQMLVYEKETERVSKYITGFSYLMRQVLEGSNQEKVSLEEEIKFLNTYLSLEQLSLEFDYKIIEEAQDESDELEIEDIFIPTMLLQPFVENAIEHGLRKSTKSEKNIEIKFTEISQNLLQVSIKDNGVGRNQERKKQHISRALEITKDRQKLMKDAFEYEIIDHKDENQNALGTEVVFSIKI